VKKYIIGGLVPWSDASGYYWDARLLLEGSNYQDLFQKTLFQDW
jgi:hypothetical protein